MKKAELTINVMIGIVLVLVLAGVLLYIFQDTTTVFSKSNTCVGRGGQCTQSCEGGITYLEGCNEAEGEVCCFGE